MDFVLFVLPVMLVAVQYLAGERPKPEAAATPLP